MTPSSSVSDEHLQNAFGRRHGGVLGIAAGRERVGRRIGNHVHLRHRQHRLPGQALDDAVETMAGSDLLRAIHAQHDLVGQPVRAEVHDGGEQEGEDAARSAPPKYSPITSSRPLSSPSSSAVFNAVCHSDSIVQSSSSSSLSGRTGSRRTRA